MTKEELKALGLTDEQVERVIDDYGKNYVSKAQFNQKNEELKTVKEELGTVKSEIDNLKKENADNKGLTEQIEKIKAEAQEREKGYKAQLHALEVDSIVERALITAKAKNPKAVRALLNLDNAKIEEGQIVGLSDQLKALVKSDAYLFDIETNKPDKNTVSGVTPGGNNAKGSGGMTKEEFQKLGYTERNKLFIENKELYEQLAGGNDNE